MRKLFLALLLLTSSAFGSTLAGTAKDANGSALPNAKVQFQIANCAYSPVKTADGSAVNAFTEITANGSGVVSGTIVGNDIITCGATSYYKVTLRKSNGQIIWTRNYDLVDANTWNIETAVPKTTFPLVPSLLNNVITQQGDLLIGGPFAIPTRLAICPNSQILQSNGSTYSCTALPGGGTGNPGGASTQVQVNNAGSFIGYSGFTFDGTSMLMTGKFGLGPSAVSSGARLDLRTGGDTTIGLSARPTNSTQTANLIQWTNSSGTVIGQIDAYGGMKLDPNTGSGMLSYTYVGQSGHWNNTTGSANAVGSPSERLKGGSSRYTITGSNFTVAQADGLFTGSVGGTSQCNTGVTCQITVDFNPYVGWTANTNTGYVYMSGIFVVNTFGSGVLENLLVEGYWPTAGVDGWNTIKNITGNTKSPIVFQIGNVGLYLKQLRFTFSNSTANALLQTIEYYPFNVNDPGEQMMMPRYSPYDVSIGVKSLNIRDDAWVIRTTMNPRVTNGGSAVAYMFDTKNNLTTTAKIAQFLNQGVEKAYIDQSGLGVFNTLRASSMTTNGVIKVGSGNGTLALAGVDDMSAPSYCADAGANDTYTCSLAPAPSTYTTGSRYWFKANTANTGAATINFNSLGAKTIKKVVGGVTTDLADNDIRAGQHVALVYDGTNMQMISQLGNSAGSTPTGSGFTRITGGVQDAAAVELSGVVVTSGSGATTPGKVDVMQSSWYCADAGANDTYACNLSPAATAYVTGAHYWFKANTANTGAATVNFNSLGAKTIKKAVGGITTDLADNDIRAGQFVDLVYDGTNMQMQSLLGNAAGSSLFTSFQVGSATAITGTDKYFQLAMGTGISANQTGTGTSGDPYIATLTVADSSTSNKGILSLTGDLAGTATSPTVAKVNGVSYPASPSTHQIPVVTAAGTVTYKTIPDCTDTGGNHLNFTQSSDAWSCGTSGGALRLDQVTAPTSNWAISIPSANTVTWTWGNSTGSANLFTLQDATTNSSATGALLAINLTTSSTVRPLALKRNGSDFFAFNQYDQITALPTITTSTGQTFAVGGAFLIKGQDDYSSPGPGVTLRGGNHSSTSNVTAGATVVTGGDATGATGSNIGGSLTLRPGGATSTSGTPGLLNISQAFLKDTTVTSGYLQCFKAAAALTVGDCGTSATNFVGIVTSASNTNPVIVQTSGIVTMQYDASVSPSAGWYACSSASTGGQVIAQSGTCAAGRQVGIVAENGTSVTSGRVLLQKN